MPLYQYKDCILEGETGPTLYTVPKYSHNYDYNKTVSCPSFHMNVNDHPQTVMGALYTAR